MKTLTIWDLDGTLVDSRPWIEAAYRYAAENMGLPVLSTYPMCGELVDNSMKTYGLDREKAVEFAGFYREYYSEHSRDVDLFDGAVDTLKALRRKGIATAVATMKAQPYAVKQLKDIGIDGLFDHITGANFDGTRSKSQMIEDCIRAGDYDEAYMIGDCPSDRKAAEEAGIKFVAAAFGYGYPVDKCIKEGIEYIESPMDVIRYL